MVEDFFAFICYIAVMGITLRIVNSGEIEKRHIRFLLTTILVPVCVFILHRTCFFGLVPHCKHCVIYEDGHKALIDANILKDYCMYAYFFLQLILIPSSALKLNGKFKKVLYIITTFVITFVLGGFVSIVSYM